MTQKTGAAHRVIVRTGGAMSLAGLRSRSGISFDFLERLLAPHRRLFTRIVCSDDLRREYRLGAFSVGQIIRCRAHAR
jgi:hypothetical protein